jgi:hypothetical protein
MTKANGLQGCGPRGSPRVKAKRPQGCGLRGSPGVTSHTLGNVRKCEGVWGSEHSHSQCNFHFGRWSPGGFPKLQRVISGVKTQWIVAFYISLEKLLEHKCLKWARLLIQTSETQVMAKRRAGGQIASLTPNQKKSWIDPNYWSVDNVPHNVGKLLMRATTLLQTEPQSKVFSQSYGAPKSRESWEKKTIWM